MYLVLSDLHLGCGDELEDFLLWGPRAAGPANRPAAIVALEAKWAAMLAETMRRAQDSGTPPTLLLVGDTFDLWQVLRPRERVASALERILDAHRPWLAALRGWIGNGGAVQLVLGNHDQPLVDPGTWAILQEVLPGLNGRTGGRPVACFADAATGLYAEHGHRWDPWNRIRAWENPAACPVGRLVVRHLVNPLEPTLPWVDKGETLADTLRMVQAAIGGERLRELLTPLRGVLRRCPTWEEALRPWSEGRMEANLRTLAEREATALDQGIRRALSPCPGGTSGPLPPHLRLFVSGHTHRPLRAGVLRRRGGLVERLNPGTWRAVAMGDGGPRTVMAQPLSYAVWAPNAAGEWVLSLRSWAEEGG